MVVQQSFIRDIHFETEFMFKNEFQLWAFKLWKYSKRLKKTIVKKKVYCLSLLPKTSIS